MGLDYALARRGPLTMAPSQVGIFAKTSPDYATPNVEFHVQPLSLDKFGDPLHEFPAITLSVCNLRPQSRGSVHAGSADPEARPRIQPNYLAADEDRRVAAASIRLARKIAMAPALAKYRPQRIPPWRRISTPTTSSCAPRARSAPRSSIPSARRRWAATTIPTRWSTPS